MRLTNLLFLTFMVFGAIGCAPSKSITTQEKQQDTIKEAAAADLQLYNDAKAALLTGNYPAAVASLNALAIRHPLNNYAHQALLETAADNIKRGQAATAVANAEKFISQNPNHPHVDYAYYHRGLVAFYDSVPALEAGDSATTTPQASAPVRRAFQYLSELLRNTPSSAFAADTTQRMLHIRNTLAQHEVNIAKHSLAQGEHARAAARAKYIVQNYQPSPAVADALAILTQVNALPPAKAPEPPVDVETVAARETAPAPATTPSSTKSWLMSQNPEHYTLQIFTTSNEKFIKKHITQHQLGDKAGYFRSGADSYALVYGAYPTKNAAQQAISQLPPYLTVGKPWIRAFKAIHTSLKQ
jgi:outer membrane protein assembly factor BamD